jgi:hypothetical protein
MERAVFGLTVLRYADGRTEILDQVAPAEFSLDKPPSYYVVSAPESWELRHRMLVDAMAEVKRQAGVDRFPQPAADTASQAPASVARPADAAEASQVLVSPTGLSKG